MSSVWALFWTETQPPLHDLCPLLYPSRTRRPGVGHRDQRCLQVGYERRKNEVLWVEYHRGGLVRTVVAARSTRQMGLQGGCPTLQWRLRERYASWVRGGTTDQR